MAAPYDKGKRSKQTVFDLAETFKITFLLIIHEFYLSLIELLFFIFNQLLSENFAPDVQAPSFMM